MKRNWTNADFDQIYRLFHGPRKLKCSEIAKETGYSYDSIRRILTAYDCVSRNDIDELIRICAVRDMCTDAVPWAFECFGKKMPSDFWEKVKDKAKEKAKGKANEEPCQINQEDVDKENTALFLNTIKDMAAVVAAMFGEIKKQRMLLEDIKKLLL